MRELDNLREKVKKRYDAGEITKEAYEEGLLRISQVESYLI